MGQRISRPSMTNVRTHTTRRSSSALARHELYMRLTALEIERTRRIAERDATSKRLSEINDRIGAIQSEQNDIKSLLDEAGTPSASQQSGNPMNFAY